MCISSALLSHSLKTLVGRAGKINSTKTKICKLRDSKAQEEEQQQQKTIFMKKQNIEM